MYSRAFVKYEVCFVSDVCRLRRQIFEKMKGKTEKILWFSVFFPKYLGKYHAKDACGKRYKQSEGKLQTDSAAKSPDALCAVL